MVEKKGELRKMQKNRLERNAKILKLKFGDRGLATINEGRIELVQLSLLKKILKRFIRKKRSHIDITREKIWYFGRPNFYIQKKSKNSRMGKGKGLIERKVIRIRRHFILFEFFGVNIVKLRKLAFKINKFLDVKFFVVSLKDKEMCLWSKKNRYFYYHEKYLY